MERDLELRVSELEKMLFLSKNVLSFDEASKFLNLSKSYLYKLTSGNLDRKSTRLNSSHMPKSRMPSSA